MTSDTLLPQRCVLVGPMGVGKTSVAHELAPKLGWIIWDNDAKLQERYGHTAHDISRDEGIGELHRREILLFHDLLATNRAVICAPGCVADDPQCLQALRDEAWVVLLTGSPPTIAGRVGPRPQHRPSLEHGPAGITPASLSRREDLLRLCTTFEVSTDNISPEQIATSILATMTDDGADQGQQRPQSSTR